MSDLVRFIKEMKAQLPPDVSVSLIAHSLGNRLMARYLAGGSTETFDSVHFIAADVDEKLFMDAARKLSTKSKRTSVYVNPSDRVLAVSGANDLLSLRITNKLGRSGFSVPSVEFLNYQQIAEPKSWEYLNVQHYLPFEHFGNIERTGAPYRGVNKGLFIVRRSSVEKGR